MTRLCRFRMRGAADDEGEVEVKVKVQGSLQRKQTFPPPTFVSDIFHHERGAHRPENSRFPI